MRQHQYKHKCLNCDIKDVYIACWNQFRTQDIICPSSFAFIANHKPANAGRVTSRVLDIHLKVLQLNCISQAPAKLLQMEN